jgi:hypothetical protein
MLSDLNLDPARLLAPFDSSIPGSLRSVGERLLLQSRSLTRHSYSTNRFLGGGSPKTDSILRTIAVGESCVLHFEARSDALARYSAQHGLMLAIDKDATLAVELVRSGLSEIIRPLDCLFSAVSELAWRCHIVYAQDEDYDVSFSDPAIPFSVFISASIRNDRRSVLRVAESLVHETMHLQLTLFESCCPLVDAASSFSMYSPWKREERPAQGILHGLYVFHVLRWMWQQVSITSENELDRDFALRRIREIDQEVSSVRPLENSGALTRYGQIFFDAIFAAC